MATSSGLYSERVKNIMNGRSTTDDRAADYKDSVEIKQTKNKLDKLEEQTRVFQAHLLKSTLNSEEHLKSIAKHTKIMAKDTLLSQVLTLAKYTYFAYRILKVFKPQVLSKSIDRFEKMLDKAGFGARGMRENCCCDGRGMSGRMGGRSRGAQQRRGGGARGGYDNRHTDQRERARQAGQNRADRVRRTATDLKNRKVTQLQAKHTQDAITKNMKNWNINAKKNITGIFNKSGAGLATSASAINKASAAGAANLTRMGLISVTGIVAGLGGLFKAGAALAGKAIAGIGGLTGIGGKAAGLLGRFGGPAALGYGAYKGYNYDMARDGGTGNYTANSGLGDKYLGKSGSTLSNTLSALTFGAVDLDRFVGSSGNAINEAYFKKHGKRLGAPTNFGQYLQSVDDTIGGLFGMERGPVSTGGNYAGDNIYSGWSKLRSFFTGVSDTIEDQTTALEKRLDTNHKDMKMSRQEARKLTEEDKANLHKMAGIPMDQGHTIGPSPVFQRPGVPASHQANDGANSTMAQGTKAPSAGDTQRRLLDGTTIHSGETLRSSGWSRYDDRGFILSTPEGFTGSAGSFNKIMSTRVSKPGSLGAGTYQGVPLNASDAMLRSIMVAETGSAGSVLDENRFIRTRVTPENNNGGHSSAYGPTQMTRDYLKTFRDRNYKSLPKEEQQYLDRLIDQNDTMLTTSRAGNYNDPVYGFGGKGTTGGTLRERQLYANIAQRSMIDLSKQHDTYESFIKSYRGANDGGYFKKIEAAAKQYGITPQEMFQRMKSMNVSDVAALDSGSPSLSPGLLNPDGIGLATQLSPMGGSNSAEQIAINMANGGAIRNKPITDELSGSLQKAIADVYGEGYKAEVYSGGQSGNRSTGSFRHNDGKAGDLRVIGPDGKMITGDALAPLAQYWLANKKGGVGLEMNQDGKGRGGIHLDTHWDPNKNNYWDYSGRTTPAQAAALKAGRAGNMPELAPVKPGAKPIQVEIAKVSLKNNSPEERIAHYSADSGLGSIFGRNKAAAEEIKNGSTKSGRIHQNSASGEVIQSRIDQAHKDAKAHIQTEQIRPDVNPEASIANAGAAITVPSDDSFNARFGNSSAANPAASNPSSLSDNPSPSAIPHYSDPELMYPLLYHHMGN